MFNQFPIPLPPLPSLPYLPPGILQPVIAVLAIILIITVFRILTSFTKDLPAALAIVGLVVVFTIGAWLVFRNFHSILQGFQNLTSPVFRWK